MCPHGPTRTSRRGEDVRMSAPGLGHRPARELCGEIVPAVAAALPAPAAVVVDERDVGCDDERDVGLY